MHKLFGLQNVNSFELAPSSALRRYNNFVIHFATGLSRAKLPAHTLFSASFCKHSNTLSALFAEVFRETERGRQSKGVVLIV